MDADVHAAFVALQDEHTAAADRATAIATALTAQGNVIIGLIKALGTQLSGGQPIDLSAELAALQSANAKLDAIEANLNAPKPPA